MNQLDHLLKIFTRFVEVGLENLKIASYHPLSRLVRFELVKFSFELLQYHIKLGSRSSKYLSELILDGALTWFRQRSTYPFGGNKLKFKSELILLKEVAKFVTGLNNFQLELIDMKAKILLYFMDDEICKFTVWLHSMNPSDTSGTYVNQQIGGQHLKFAYEIDPILAVNLAMRYKLKSLDELLQQLIIKDPLPAISYPDAVQFFIGINAGTHMPSYHLLFWAPLAPIDSITLFYHHLDPIHTFYNTP